MDYNKVVCNNFQNCFYIIICDVLTMAENMSNKSNDYKNDAKNDEVKSIVLGLFALIGFIIIIYSIFMGVVGEPLHELLDVLVHHGVHRDVINPFFELLLGRQLAIKDQISSL